MPDHFVETNIIIGYTVKWDRQAAVVQRYLDSTSGVGLRTSPRVLSEAEDVINKRRRLAKQAAKRIFQNFDSGRYLPSVDDIVDFVYGELSDYRDSVVDHVIQHIKDNESYYIGLTQDDNRRVLQATTEDIDDDFDSPINVISDIKSGKYDGFNCSIFTETKSDYSNYVVSAMVDNVLSEKPTDRDILLDAYHLTQKENIQTLYFVTIDRDFLDNESRLESRLGTIDIEHPDSV